MLRLCKILWHRIAGMKIRGLLSQKEKPPHTAEVIHSGIFELNGTNEMCLKTENFLIYPINLLLQLFFEVLLS